VGAYRDGDGGDRRGAVWILLLNTDGTVKSHQKISDTAGNFTGVLDNGDLFGVSVASLGDHDGDGVGDCVVGAQGDDDGGSPRGAVWVLFLNSDGTVKSHQKISDTAGNFTGVLDSGDHFSVSVASLGDHDGDGIGDLAVGAYGDDDGGNAHGAVWVLFLDSDGTAKSHQKISDTEGSFTGVLDDVDGFGLGVSSLGDLDCDGEGDLAVGAGYDDDGGNGHGAVWVLFLNSDGTVKSHQKISDTDGNFTGILDDNDAFGTSVASLGDLDGDGVTDMVAGASHDDDGGADVGAVWVLFLDSEVCPGYTPIGKNVEVVPPDSVTGDTLATVTFDSVTVAGKTSLITTKGGPDPEYGFRLCKNNSYFDILTTAEYIDSITVCIDYTELQCGGSKKSLQLFHWENGAWEAITVSHDLTRGVICGRVASFSTFAIFEEYIGSVAGRVTADCPDPATAIAGVDIDAFEMGAGELAGSDITDEYGAYHIDSLATGDYSISIVTPLGYSALDDEIIATVLGGEETTVDFGVSCLYIQPSQRSIGFWKHQVGVALGGKGHAEIDGPTLCGYLDLIELHFNSNAINQVEIYDPPASGDCQDKLEVAKDLLNLKGNVGMTARAKQQLMALLLNVASQKLGLRTVISEDGASVSQAITFCDSLIDDPQGDHENAKTIADWINNAQVLSAGIIPLDTNDIDYSPQLDNGDVPKRFALAQNHPNPFNPTTTIAFDLPVRTSVRLVIYDVSGRLIRTLVDDEMSPGQQSVRWDGRDAAGRKAASGVYFYRLETPAFNQSRKMILLQ
jgi:hypothetical protein